MCFSTGGAETSSIVCCKFQSKNKQKQGIFNMIIYIWGIFMTIVGLKVVIGNIGKPASANDGFVGGVIALIVGLGSIYLRWYVKNGNKCPHCGKPHGPKLVNYEIVSRGRTFRRNNREYEQQIRDNYYKCKFCQKEWVVKGVKYDEILHY